jgi:hypothetical protein
LFVCNHIVLSHVVAMTKERGFGDIITGWATEGRRVSCYLHPKLRPNRPDAWQGVGTLINEGTCSGTKIVISVSNYCHAPPGF